MFDKIILPIILSVTAAIIYAYISSKVNFRYRQKCIPLLYNLINYLEMLENGLIWHNEYMVYTSLISIRDIAEKLLAEDYTYVNTCKEYKKLVNTVGMLSIEYVGRACTAHKGLGIEEERVWRLDELKRNFFSNEYTITRLASDTMYILNDRRFYREAQDYENIHLLDIVGQVDLWDRHNSNEVYKTNEELIAVLIK